MICIGCLHEAKKEDVTGILVEIRTNTSSASLKIIAVLPTAHTATAKRSHEGTSETFIVGFAVPEHDMVHFERLGRDPVANLCH